MCTFCRSSSAAFCADVRVDRDGLARLHCVIDQANGILHVRDLASETGTLVNGYAAACRRMRHHGEGIGAAAENALAGPLARVMQGSSAGQFPPT